jgi:hypothetical protein
MRAQCHAFPHASDKKCVRNRQECKVLTETEVSGMEEDYRLICKGRVTRVDAGNNVSHAPECFVLF